MKRHLALGICAVSALGAMGCAGPQPQTTVRVAVIGGMVDTKFFQAIGRRFEQATGHRVEIVASGPKRVIAEAFTAGQADLITMHASDTIINLVADGYAVDPQPWLKNDLILVGPPSDPAGIKGLTDAAEALKKIKASGSTFVVHASLGAQEVLRDVMADGNVTLDLDRTEVLFTDKARQVLQIAAGKSAYTLVGRIPFLDGKLANEGLVVMVRGDPRLRRPYVVTVANPARFPKAHVEAARQLARFLRDPRTQQWIAQYGRGQLDEQSLFFPVQVPTQPAQ
jgi:tungstate transport system substrate-binding protein